MLLTKTAMSTWSPTHPASKEVLCPSQCHSINSAWPYLQLIDSRSLRRERNVPKRKPNVLTKDKRKPTKRKLKLLRSLMMECSETMVSSALRDLSTESLLLPGYHKERDKTSLISRGWESPKTMQEMTTVPILMTPSVLEVMKLTIDTSYQIILIELPREA